MKSLPVDERGYVVPWFVEWIDGKPEFRAMDGRKWERAILERRCWVCGEKLGRFLTFVIGPMCGVNRTASEPPCHLECARWSARNCPFLSRPHMARRDHEQLKAAGATSSGVLLERNPGVTLLWTTRSYEVFDAGNGKPLIEIGESEQVEWWAERLPATREQVTASVESGLPFLAELAKEQAGGLEALARMKAMLEDLYPHANGPDRAYYKRANAESRERGLS